MLPPVLVVDLGHLVYGQALALQRSVALARIERRIDDDVLLLVEHPPVVTLGRGARNGHLLASRELLATRGVELFDVERGGDVTFHGPGQLVGYPILDLKRHRQDLHWYLRQVEEVLIRTVASFGVTAARNPGYTGVWTRGMGEEATALRFSPGVPPAGPGEADLRSSEHATLRKIASIGVHARDWVTWHGFALNVTTDLSYFDLMVPCGITGVSMTSIQREMGDVRVAARVVREQVVHDFGEVFDRMPAWRGREEVETVIGGGALPVQHSGRP